jgi:hypothetical protein
MFCCGQEGEFRELPATDQAIRAAGQQRSQQ